MHSDPAIVPSPSVADDRDMGRTAMRPVVGSLCRAVADHSLRLAVVGRPVLVIPRGTRLRIARLDERWDNSHALIAAFAEIRATLCILDGPSAGEEIAIVIAGDAVPRQDGGASESWALPEWLAIEKDDAPARG